MSNKLIIQTSTFCLNWPAHMITSDKEDIPIGNTDMPTWSRFVKNVDSEYGIDEVHLFGNEDYLKGLVNNYSIDSVKTPIQYKMNDKINIYINE